MKLFVLFITVVFLDFIIGSLLTIFYFKQQSGDQYRRTYAIEKTTEDLLIFGASTALHNYHPKAFEKGLKMSTYNVGIAGESIVYHYAILKAVLKRYTPKMIIYDFNGDELVKNQSSYDRLSFLLPYYKRHPEIRAIVDLKSPYEKYKLLSNIYPYNSSIFSIAVGNAEFNKKRREDINGYLPLTGIWNEPIKDGSTFLQYEELDSNKIKIFESFIKDCINLKIELYVVISPVFIKPNYIDNLVALGEKIAKKNNVNFFDYSKDSTFLNNPELFADIRHFNQEGAKIYSNKIIESIKGISKLKTIHY